MRISAQLLLTFVLNAAWQVALITACAALCDWFLRGTAARYRHALWVGTLFLSVCVPILSSSHVIKPLLLSQQSRTEIRDEPIVVSTIVSGDVEPLPAPTRETRVAVEPAGRSSRLSHLSVSQKLAGVLVALFLLFLIHRSAKLFRAWRSSRAIVSSAYEFRFPEPIQEIIQQCLTAIGVRRVRILWSPLVPVPITVGVLNPLVILPESLLHQVDRELLTSAVGHELVHVARRDYLANLIYEFLYLPLSFHPAAALARRRIKQTRELCCDESVAAKLLKPEIYARSLVRLIGSVPITRRLAANTTIGITESDNLEVRIMSLLKTPKLTPRRKTVLLVTALLVLAVPSVAATSFAFTLDIEQRQAPNEVQSQQTNQEQDKHAMERREQERAREELKRQERALTEQLRIVPEAQRAEMEKQLSELRKDLAAFDREMQEYNKQHPGLQREAEARLREVQQNLEIHNRIMKELQEKQELDVQKQIESRLKELLRKYPDEASQKRLREMLVELERQGPDVVARRQELEKSAEEIEKSGTDRKAKVIYKVEPTYTEDARAKQIEGSVQLGVTVDQNGMPQNIQVKRSLYPSLDQAAIAALRLWRFEPGIKDGQPVSMYLVVEMHFTIESKRIEQEQKEREKAALGKGEGSGEATGQGNGEGSGSGPVQMRRRKDVSDQGREERARRQVEMTRGATISMDRAVQIAVSQYPGKVLAASLGRDGDKIFYHLVIINTDGDKSTTTYVWLSATDGQIFKTEKERENREQQW